MSLASVRAFLSENAPDLRIIESDSSSATVALAAAAYGVQPAQISKTLTLRIGDEIVLLAASGDARIDNRKAKLAFGRKVSMLAGDEVEAVTGHPIGGVCPFGLARPLRVYCDVSLLAFDEVLPAAGSTNSAVRISPRRMAALVDAVWIDVCQDPPAPG